MKRFGDMRLGPEAAGYASDVGRALSEKVLMAQILGDKRSIGALSAWGWFATRIEENPKTSKAGIPDIVATKNGVTVFIELKRAHGRDTRGRMRVGGKQSPAQVEWQRRLEAAGGLYLLIHTVEELEEALKCIVIEVPRHMNGPELTITPHKGMRIVSEGYKKAREAMGR